MSSLQKIPKKVFSWVKPTDTIKKLYEIPFADRLSIAETDSEMHAYNEVAPFYFKHVQIDYDKISFDDGTLDIEKKGDQIFISCDGEVKKSVEYSEAEFQKLIDFYLAREKTSVEIFLVCNTTLLKLLPPLEITFCLYILHNPDSEGWEFFKRCTGTLKFLNLYFEVDPDIMKIPIIAGSRGIVFHGQQTNETLFESKHMYILHSKYVPSMEQLKDFIKFWQLSKREEGAFCFDCSADTFEKYKKEFESWPGSYTRPRLGLPIRKELSIELHSAKRIVISPEVLEKNGMVRVVMAIVPKHPIDSFIDLIERIKASWARSTDPAAAKKGAESNGQK